MSASAIESNSAQRQFTPPPRHPSSTVPSLPILTHEAPNILEDDPPQPATFSTDNDDASIMEHDLTEKELRETYENEEIDRFLYLFSAHVTEVRLPELPNDGSVSMPGASNRIPVRGVTGILSSASSSDSPQSAGPTLSEKIASGYISSILPPPRPPAPPFTLGRLRVTTQRLYLAVLPIYGPFFARLARLATWEDPMMSGRYCALFWILWWYDLILPALIFRIICSLAKRRLFPYPSLKDLRQHRAEILRAEEFGDKLSSRLAATSTFGVKEMWRMFKVINQPKKSQLKNLGKDKGNPEDESAKFSPRQDATLLDDADDSEDTQDIKCLVLNALNEIADLHEKVKNIFIWRRPTSSRTYSIALSLLFVVTLLVPARILSKIAYFITGVFFWHVVPIIAALSPSERARIPPAFSDVPTDAEYAMQLISQRIALGLDVKPTKIQNRKRNRSQTLNSLDTLTGETNRPGHKQSQSDDKSVDWKKWSDRVAFGKSLATDGKRLLTNQRFPPRDLWPSRDPITSQAGESEISTDTHSYPAQYSSAPGLITVSSSTLYFTPLLSKNAKLIMPLSSIRGVKKTGMLKGLNIRWSKNSMGSDSSKTEVEEIFLWVGDRDDLFARLVSSDSRWIKV